MILAGRGEMVDRPDLVGSHNSTEQSVFLGLDVDQVEHVPANIVDPGVKMYRNQPVTDGPAGQDRTRRPVGTEGMHAVNDSDRPTAGGPVGRLFNLDPLGPSRMPSLNELNQPLAMGPLGTEGMHAVNNSDRPTAGGPVGRLFNLDPLGPSRMPSLDELNQPLDMGPLGTEGIHAVNDSDRPTAGGPVGRSYNLDPLGPSGMSSSDEWNQPPAVGPVGKPSITGPLGNDVSESDCRQTIKSESESSAGVPDPVIQTGSDIQADRVNIGTANGPAGSGDTPPSSDSGVHSLGEQWENMSTNSMDMESEQNEKPSYGGDTRRLVSETSRPPNTEEGNRFDCPWTDCVLERKSDDISSVVIQRDDREVEFNKLTIYESEHSIVYSGTDGRNSDIAAMSDFSDDEEETQVELRPGPRTGSDRDGSIEEESSLCDRPIANTVTAGDGRDSLDPNKYWTNFRRLTRQAFLLDDDCLSDSNYPDAVKDVVRRSRLTIMALNEYDAPPFEQRTDCGTPGCSDSEDITESDESEGEDSAVRDNRPYEMRTYTPPPPP